MGVWDTGNDLLERYHATVLLQKIQLLPKRGERQVKRAIAAASVEILNNVVVSQH
jgi:hypothetical protein